MIEDASGVTGEWINGQLEGFVERVLKVERWDAALRRRRPKAGTDNL